MRICVFGAGAIGGYLAAGLAQAGNDVSVVARGSHLSAIQRNGLRLISEGGEVCAHVTATENPADLGCQDLVISTLKAHQAWESAHQFLSLLRADTPVISAVNGLPWWYFYGTSDRFTGNSLNSVDPERRQWQVIGPERAIGCIVEPACEVIEPGVVLHRADRVPGHGVGARARS